MPTLSGGETLGERLTRLRCELARVRETIERAENNGISFNIGGSQVTQVAYERAIKREKQLENQIATLEARVEGRSSPSRALIKSKMA